MRIEHKFLKSYPLEGKKILIIGTFNPETICNPADFFYSRARNFFWELLPAMFNKEDSLKGKEPKEKIEFLKRHDIELTDLILFADIEERYLGEYGDDKLSVPEEEGGWNTENIINILKQGNTKEVYFTRKSFQGVQKIQKEIKKIEAYCQESEIKFRYLPTPARFCNKGKKEEWEKAFGKSLAILE